MNFKKHLSLLVIPIQQNLPYLSVQNLTNVCPLEISTTSGLRTSAFFQKVPYCSLPLLILATPAP